MDITIEPALRISGCTRVPGDKSISHRAVILAAMTAGECRLEGLAPGADVASTIGCLKELGFRVAGSAGGLDAEVIVEGNGWRPAKQAVLDAGNSGTTMRLLTGALAGSQGSYSIRGDSSLSQRPMARVADPLRLMGAGITLSDGDRPPVGIKGSALHGIDYRLPVPSAQVKSAILLAGLQAKGTTRIEEPVASRDHTERLLEWLGANVESGESRVRVSGGAELFGHAGFQMTIPGDLSSAAYLLAAAVLSPHGKVEVDGVGLNPSRTGILEILERMGADIRIEAGQTPPGLPEPSGKITAVSSQLKGTDVGGNVIPAAIDELPLVALAATQATGTTVISDAAELKVKESDRINVLAVALKQLGASIDQQPDGWVIEGPSRLKGGRVNPGGDHRIALTLAVAGTLADGPVTIEDWECTQISFPGFEQELAMLTGQA